MAASTNSEWAAIVSRRYKHSTEKLRPALSINRLINDSFNVAAGLRQQPILCSHVTSKASASEDSVSIFEIDRSAGSSSQTDPGHCRICRIATEKDAAGVEISDSYALGDQPARDMIGMRIEPDFRIALVAAPGYVVCRAEPLAPP